MRVRHARSQGHRQEGNTDLLRVAFSFVRPAGRTHLTEKALDGISPDEIFHFLEDLTRNQSKSTRRLRYAQLKAFYNFIIDRCSPNMRNPCNASLLSKSFKAPKQAPHKNGKPWTK
jgi:integrase